MEFMYRLIEHIDGEQHLRIIPYKVGQRIKCWLLLHIV